MPTYDSRDPFAVRLTRQAEKDLKELRGHTARVLRALAVLQREPHAGHTLAGSLKRVRALEFGLPGGEHRAAYFVLVGDRVCLVFAIGPHENFYRLAERRYEALRKSGELADS